MSKIIVRIARSDPFNRSPFFPRLMISMPYLLMSARKRRMSSSMLLFDIWYASSFLFNTRISFEKVRCSSRSKRRSSRVIYSDCCVCNACQTMACCFEVSFKRMPFPRRVWIGPMCKSARNVLISFKSLRIVRPLAAVSSASCSMDSG